MTWFNNRNQLLPGQAVPPAGVSLITPPDPYQTLSQVMQLIETVVVEGTGDKTFMFQQDVPSDTWDIYHGLFKYPSVSVIDSAGTNVVGDIQYVSLSHVVVLFALPFAGKAYLN